MSINTPFQTAFEMEENYHRGNNRYTSGVSQQGAYNIFKNYAANNHYPNRQNAQQIRNTNGQSHKRYVTEASQISHVDGFKKIKLNQFEKLKQLRQQYEILKGLPLQDQFLKHTYNKKHDSSEFESRREPSQSQPSSSHQSSPQRKHKHKHANSSHNNNDRNLNLLTMEKRNLQVVIGNSMRKIEQLQNQEMKYKRIIHELNLQLDNRSNQDKLQNLTKTMKRNENQLNERIEGLKRQIQRHKQINKQIQDRNGVLQNELQARTQQIRKMREDKRQFEDQIRLEKDKFLNLEIDIKRLTMERQLLQRQKNNQINRLKSIVEISSNTISSTQIKKYEEQIKNQKHKYDTLLMEFQRYKQNTNFQPKQNTNQGKKGDDQMRLFQALINHLRQQSLNQNRASMDLISSMVAKIDDKNKSKFNMENSRVLDQLYNLRNEVTNLRRDKDDKSSPLINLAESVQQYQGKIRILQREIEDGSITKQNLMKQYENIRSAYQYTKQQYQKLNLENQKLKQRIRQLQSYNANQFSQDARQLRRQLDEALFMVEKGKQQGQFNVHLARTQNQSNMRLIQDQIARVEGEKQLLRQELDKMRNYYETKIQEKNTLLEKTASQFAILNQTKQQTLTSYKQNNERELGQLIRKIQSMAELNQRYSIQSVQMSNLQRQLHELRYSVKRMKGINDGVDHLWQVKETEYENINQIMRQCRMQ